MAPTITKPFTINVLPSPLAVLTNCARPTVPPAPGMLVTCALFAAPDATIACCIDRAVWSQPPPGAAGAMIFSSICAAAGVAASAAAAISRPRKLGRFHKDMAYSSVIERY